MKTKTMLAILALFLVLPGLFTHSNACTTFRLKDSTHLVVGRNFDFDFGKGFIAINRKDLVKSAFLSPDELPAQWTSKYGSITFNLFGKSYPMSGMNEAGLVVAQMWLQGAQYPQKDDRPAVDELQWVQYQLDNCATIQEVIATNQDLRISQSNAHSPLHYLICDAQGQVASIEFLNGEIVVHKNEELPFPLMGNLTCQKAMAALPNYEPFGGTKTITDKWHTLEDLTALACQGLKNFKPESSDEIIHYAFNLLKKVGSPTRTQWSVVFDISNRSIHFRSLENSKIRTLEMANFNYSCGSHPLIVDIQESTPKNIQDQHLSYSDSLNYKYTREAYLEFKKIFPPLPEVSEELHKIQTAFPSSYTCKEE